MAEAVQLESEKWIPELEQMERILLFEKDEIRAITKKRKELFYKMNRRTKNKQDYLNIIQYEMNLLKLIRLRRSKTHNNFKKAAIDYSIIGRIHLLFKKVIARFKHDTKLWTSHIKFCKDVRSTISINRMLIDMLKVHSNKPKLWVFAAKWEFEESKSITNARKFLLRGLRFHPESELLYAQAIKLELQNEQKENSHSLKIDSPDIDEEKLCKFADIFLNEAMKNIQNINFYSHLLNITLKYQFTQPLQEKICNHLSENFDNNYLTKHVLARKHVSQILTKNIKNVIKTDEAILKSQILNCYEVYIEALKVHPSLQLYSLLIGTLNELISKGDYLKAFKENLLHSTLHEAHKAGMLEESAYIQLDEILKSKDKSFKLVKILSVATSKFPNSFELWNRRLNILYTYKLKEEAENVFAQASSYISDENELQHLWEKRLAFYSTCEDDNEIEAIYKQGINLPQINISAEIRSSYLEWIYKTKGISLCRNQYHKMLLHPPLKYSFFTKMFSIETSREPPSASHIRKCFNKACNYFGTSKLELWMNYIKFERDTGEPSNIPAIYNQAIKQLEPLLVDKFINEFTLFKINN